MLVRKVYLPHSLSQLLPGDGSPATVLAAAQQMLKKLGHYQGDITGATDAATREAIIRFQEEQHIKSTGELSPVTYCRLQQATVSEIEPEDGKDRANFALARANIFISKSARRLTLLDGQTALRNYPLGIGKPTTPTPVGNFAIATKVMNPGGVLGTRWMGLNYDTYGIHGTNKPWLIGQMVSLGCIRMHNANAEELYALVNIGTPVVIRD